MLKVIGAGLGRTGTLSLKQALESLGLGPCHHMEEVLKNPDQLPYWQAAAMGEPIDWERLLAPYRSSVDWPSAHFWRTLANRYPDAKVILSVRDPERWYASFSGTILKLTQNIEKIPEPVRSIIEMGNTIIGEQFFEGRMDDKEFVISRFRRHNEEVKATIPPERLLVYEVAEGWGPLCRFLGAGEPATAFPRTNSTEEFWELVGGKPA